MEALPRKAPSPDAVTWRSWTEANKPSPEVAAAIHAIADVLQGMPPDAEGFRSIQAEALVVRLCESGIPTRTARAAVDYAVHFDLLRVLRPHPQLPSGLDGMVRGTITLWKVARGEYPDWIGPRPEKTPPAQNGRPGEPATADDPKGTRGVSLLDAATSINDGDSGLAHKTVGRWQKQRKVELPASVGRCPKHRQRKLYEPSALCDFLEKIGDLEFSRKKGLLRDLRRLAR